MTHATPRLLLLVLAALLLAACRQDGPLVTAGTQQEQKIAFGFRHFTPVSIATRAALPSVAENRLISLYMMVFADDGSMLYQAVYDHTNLDAPGEPVRWEVDNQGSPGFTRGTIYFRCKDVERARIYLVANCSNDIMNISHEFLDNIHTEQQLQEAVCAYQTPTFMRNGTLKMTAWTTVAIQNGLLTLAPNGEHPGTYEDLGQGHYLWFIRGDAKLTVKVGVVPGAVTTNQVYNPLLDRQVDVRQTIESFEPETWQIVNLPDRAWLFPDLPGTSRPTHAPGVNLVASQPYEFEGSEARPIAGDDGNPVEQKLHTFTVYSLDNVQQAKKSVADGTAYGSLCGKPALRDKRVKQADGTYPPDHEAVPGADIWEFAPAGGTYLVVRGVVRMEYDEDRQEEQTLSANVTYYIHLGDINEDPDDYSMHRNTHYTYYVNIRGVNNIHLEVERDAAGWLPGNEPQPAAAGRVYVAQEPIVTLDCHYGQRVYRFNAEKILRLGNLQDLTWSVYTPFGRNGSPNRVGPDKVEVPTGLDYKWVKFLMHTREAEYTEPHAGPGGAPRTEANNLSPRYCQKSRWYPGQDSPELMDVMDLCHMLRTEAAKYKQLRTEWLAGGGQLSDETFKEQVARETLFDTAGDIYLTAFVDEFHYDVDPISDLHRDNLWHEFANQQNRAMHIMCDAKTSTDGESTRVGTAVTLYQRSIQTIYNTSVATEGWGVETEDELKGPKYFFNRAEEHQEPNGKGWNNSQPLEGQISSATSYDNGLYNTARLIGMPAAGPFPANLYWSDYVEYSRTNSEMTDPAGYGTMKAENDKAVMRYSWLARNRDLNGNGQIDLQEVRWYMASLNQLKNLFVGDQGITYSARLYNNEESSMSADLVTEYGQRFYPWREHVVCSTVRNDFAAGGALVSGGFYPAYLWAEEGVSYSRYGQEWGKTGRLGSRCVRNLGFENNIADANSFPRSIYEATANADGTYTFDLSWMNDKSKNINIFIDPLPMDEHSASSRPVNRFQTGPFSELTGYQIATGYGAFKSMLESGFVDHGPGMEGYRTPSLREMVVIHSHLGGTTINGQYWNNAFVLGCANYSSFGQHGNNLSVGSGSWGFQGFNITFEVNTPAKILTVKTLE